MQAMYTLSSGKTGQFTTFDKETGQKTRFIQPGQSECLIDHAGCGIVTRLWITFPGWFYRHWDEKAAIDPTVLRLTILKIYFDNEAEPSVLAPLSDFFGVGHCEYRHYTSELLGMSSGGFYCYFPMPFASGMRLEIENLHSTETAEVFVNMNYRILDALPDDCGRFHTSFVCAQLEGGDPIVIANIQGAGHFAGCALSIQGEAQNNLSFLEAPEYMYIDGESEASIIGTGLEDYFNGGWYFRNGEFYCNTHGVPLKDPLRAMVSMYRFHDQDRIHFQKSFRMEFVSPWRRERLGRIRYSATAYYYLDTARGACDLPDSDSLSRLYRIRDVDFQSIP